MDSLTARFYDENASVLAEAYGAVGGVWLRRLDHAMARARTVLDIGCGTGRDLAHLLLAGKDAYGADPSAAMLEEARHHLASLELEAEGRLFQTGLPHPENLPLEKFDGVICCAVLMHLAEDDLPVALGNLRTLLHAEGTLLLSVPANRPMIDPDSRRDATGRLFTDLPLAALESLLSAAGFSIESAVATPDGLGRPGHSWHSLVCHPTG